MTATTSLPAPVRDEADETTSAWNIVFTFVSHDSPTEETPDGTVGHCYFTSRSGRAFAGSWAEVANRLSSDASTSSLGSVVASIDQDPHPEPATASRVRFFKDASGLTWDQASRLFGVSRRSVHLWASGGRMNASNLEKLGYLEQVVDALGVESAELRRDALLRSKTGKPSVFQQLLGQEWVEPVVSIEARTESTGEGPIFGGALVSAEAIEDSTSTR